MEKLRNLISCMPQLKTEGGHFWRGTGSAFKSAEDLEQYSREEEQNFQISLSSLLEITPTQFKSTELLGIDFTHSHKRALHFQFLT